MSIKTKLAKIMATKSSLRDAIARKGISVPSTISVFRKIPEYIQKIKSVLLTTTSVTYDTLYKKETYFTAPVGQAWTSVQVNMLDELYDFLPSNIGYFSSLFGLWGTFLDDSYVDYANFYLLDSPYTSGYVESRKHLVVNGVMEAPYHEGCILVRSNQNELAYIFCMRNFNCVGVRGTYPNYDFRVAGALIVKYNEYTKQVTHVERTYSLSDGSSTSSKEYFSVGQILYASRPLYYLWFGNGGPYPRQLYPKPFTVKMDLSIFPYRDKVHIYYAGPYLQISFWSQTGELFSSWRSNNGVAGVYDHTIHKYEISTSSFPKDEIVIVEFTGFISALGGSGYTDADYSTISGVPYLLSATTEILTPLPLELQWADGLFLGSKITNVPSNIFERCKSRLSSVDGMFSHCNNLTSTFDGLFKDCTKITSFDYLYYHCAKLRTVYENTFLTMGAVRSISHAFSYDYVQTTGDFTSCIENSIEDMSFLFSHYGDYTNVANLWANVSVSILPKNGQFPKLKTIKGLFYNSHHIKSVRFELLNAPLLTDLTSMFQGSQPHNMLSATVNISTNGQNMNLTQMFYDQQRLADMSFSFSGPAGCVVHADHMFNMCVEMTYCPPLWNHSAFRNASHNGCFYFCTSASNYQQALNSGWATYTSIGS